MKWKRWERVREEDEMGFKKKKDNRPGARAQVAGTIHNSQSQAGTHLSQSDT